MARKPKLPKPKLPLGQRVKQETKKAVASGLTRNFGILGSAVAKRYLSPTPRVSRSKGEAAKGTDKNIKKKKLKDKAPANESILESAKLVKDAVDVVATNATRGFAAATRQSQIMGEDVTAALNDLAGLLDQLLYRKKAQSSAAGGGSGGTSSKKADDDQDSGSGLSSLRNRGRAPRVRKNPNKLKPRSPERLKKAKARASKMGGGNKFRPRIGGGLRLPGIFNLGMAGVDAYSEYSATGNMGRAGAGFAGDVGGGMAGAAAGAFIGSLIFPGLGTLAGGLIGGIGGSMGGKYAAQSGYDALNETSQSGASPSKVTIGGSDRLIHKLKYKSDKITFKATNSITFKSRIRQSGGAGGAGENKKPNAGFWNGIADKLSWSGGGAGAAPSAGFFNGLVGGGGGGTKGTGAAGAAAGAGSGATGSPTGAGVPNDIIAKAREVASSGGPGAVSEFMRSQGYPQSGAWCGQFAASVVKASGGTPPQNPSIASNWRNFGTEVTDPQPGDVAVRKGAPTGAMGSHVTLVDKVDPKSGTFTGIGGNQGRMTASGMPLSGYTYHRGTQPTPNSPGTPTVPGAQPTAAVPGDGPGKKMAPNGEEPSAFIMHHTGTKPDKTAQSIVEDWRRERPGVGAQYIMDRDGNIHDVKKEFDYGGTGHVNPKYTPEEYKRQGIANDKIVGMEIMAQNDKDVTPAQRKAAAAFVAKHYSQTRVLGHGQVNPGHRQDTEGMSAVKEVEADRARRATQAAQPPTPETKAPPTADYGLPKEGRSLSFLEKAALKSQYKDDYDALPADIRAKVDAGKPITNEDIAKIRPESQQKLNDAGVIKMPEKPRAEMLDVQKTSDVAALEPLPKRQPAPSEDSNPPESRDRDTSTYQKTGNDDLDHSPKKVASTGQSYSDYMNTTNDSEAYA